MSGSVDRLVVTRLMEIGSSDLDPAQYSAAAFNFRDSKWKRLPNPPAHPFALPDGAVSVDIPCIAAESGWMNCQVAVWSMHWDDHAWSHRQVTKRAVHVRVDFGDLEWGSQHLGDRGGYAFFRVDRDRDRRLLRVNVDGKVKTLPKPPVSNRPTFHDAVTCAADDGLDSVAIESGPPGSELPALEYGPISHLDDSASKPTWKVVGVRPIEFDGPGKFVCGAHGLVFMQQPTTVAWSGDRFVTIARSGTPVPPEHAGLWDITAPLASGGFAFRNNRSVWRLQHGRWHEWPILTKPGNDQLWEITTVGDLVIYQVLIYDTTRFELRVIPSGAGE